MDRPATMMEPPIEDLLARVVSKFTLVTLTARRAREINAYFNQLGQGLGAIVPPQVSSNSTKPVSIALDEIYQGRIVPKYPEPDQSGAGEESGDTRPKSA